MIWCVQTFSHIEVPFSRKSSTSWIDQAYDQVNAVNSVNAFEHDATKRRSGAMKPPRLTLLAAILDLAPTVALPAAASFSLPTPRRGVLLTGAVAVHTQPSASQALEDGSLSEVLVTAGQDLTQTTLEDYAAMRDDRQRTDAYAAAIRDRVSSAGKVGPTVLDLGTGPFALLAIIAARAGARKVYAIERTPSVAKQARKVVEDEGLEKVITVIEGDSQDVNLPEKVDLIVSELVGNVATGEGVVETIRDARRRFLREDVPKTEAMIPARCQTAIAPVMYVNHELLAAKGPEFLRPFKLFSETQDLTFLAKPQLLEDFDLCSLGGPGVDDLHESEDLFFDLESGQNSLFSGFALWPRVVVDEQRTVDVQSTASHWSYVVALMAQRRIPVPRSIALHTEVDLRQVPYCYRLRGQIRTEKSQKWKISVSFWSYSDTHKPMQGPTSWGKLWYSKSCYDISWDRKSEVASRL